MDITQILAAIDAEIGRLQQVREMLAGSTAGRGTYKRAVFSPARKKRHLSAEARARIAAAQRARWAKAKKQAK